LLLDTRTVAEAYTQAYATKQFFEAQGLVLQATRARLVMAGALLKSVQQSAGDQEQLSIWFQEAVFLCKQALTRARQLNLQEHVYKCQHLLGKLAACQGDVSQVARHYQAAIAQI